MKNTKQMQMSVDEAMVLAESRYKAGEYADAEQMFRDISDQSNLLAAKVGLLNCLVKQSRHLEVAVTARSLLKKCSSPVDYHNLFALISRALTAHSTALADMPGDMSMTMPCTAEIEMTAHCQLKCPFCRTGGALRHKYPEVPRGLMTEETLRRILAEVPSLFSVLLYNWGEPFLHPQISSMVKIVKSHDIHCELSSNMQLMSEKTAEAIVDSGLDFLRVSCDGLTQYAYEKYRVGGSLDKVISNTKLVTDAKMRRKSMFPIIIFQMVVNKYNQHQVNDFAAFAKERGADFTSVITVCSMTDEGEQLIDDYAPTDPAYPRWRPGPTPLTGCRQPWNHASFDWNGDVYTCCNPSGKQHLRMGNILETSFADIWNGPLFRYARRMVRTGQLSDDMQPIACGTLCHKRQFG